MQISGTEIKTKIFHAITRLQVLEQSKNHTLSWNSIELGTIDKNIFISNSNNISKHHL